MDAIANPSLYPVKVIESSRLLQSELASSLVKAAKDAGFDAAGVAPVDHSPELAYFPEWIASGYAGDMNYLKRCDSDGRLKRASLSHVAPWARSVIVCAINYNTDQPYSTFFADQTANRDRGWISRYAWFAEDYHDSILRRLRVVEQAVKDEALKAAVAERFSDPIVTRSYVDTGPVVERVVAKYAGIGWIGKNTCIINQQLGSWLFLGVILTSLEMDASLPALDRCGTCTRCIDACPTDALIAPYKMDATRCISYLTIEKRGSLAPQRLETDLRDGMRQHIFGCDICQDVCPWNRKAPATQDPEFQPRPELINPPLQWLAEMSEEDFQQTFRGSPLRRPKRCGIRRNAVIAMGNSRDEQFVPVLKKLAEDADSDVADAAAWSLSKFASKQK